MHGVSMRNSLIFQHVLWFNSSVKGTHFKPVFTGWRFWHLILPDNAMWLYYLASEMCINLMFYWCIHVNDAYVVTLNVVRRYVKLPMLFIKSKSTWLTCTLHYTCIMELTPLRKSKLNITQILMNTLITTWSKLTV